MVGDKWKKKKKWNSEENLLFVWVVFKVSAINFKRLGDLSKELWEVVSIIFGGRESEELIFKWKNILKSATQEEFWRPDEDDLLRTLYYEFKEKNGVHIKWNNLARRMFEISHLKFFRLGKHCRERWRNHLTPNLIKTEWTMEEDKKLKEGFKKHGRVWSDIAKTIPGRTLNSIKNRFKKLKRGMEITEESGQASIDRTASKGDDNCYDDSKSIDDETSEMRSHKVPLSENSASRVSDSTKILRDTAAANEFRAPTNTNADKESKKLPALKTEGQEAQSQDEPEKEDLWDGSDGDEGDSLDPEMYSELMQNGKFGEKNILDEMIKNMRMKKKNMRLNLEKKEEKYGKKQMMKNKQLMMQTKPYLVYPTGEGNFQEAYDPSSIMDPSIHHPSYGNYRVLGPGQSPMVYDGSKQMRQLSAQRASPQRIASQSFSEPAQGGSQFPVLNLPPAGESNQRFSSPGFVPTGFLTQCCGSPVFVAPSCHCNNQRFPPNSPMGPVNINMIFRAPPGGTYPYSYPQSPNLQMQGYYQHQHQHQPTGAYRYPPM